MTAAFNVLTLVGLLSLALLAAWRLMPENDDQRALEREKERRS